MRFHLSMYCLLLLLFSAVSAQHSLISPAQPLVESGINALYNYQFDQAITLLDSARNTDPEHPVAPFILIAAKWLKAQTELGYDSSYVVLIREAGKAVPVYKQLIKAHPENAEYYLYLGSTYGIRARVALAQKAWIDVLYSGYQGYKMVRIAQALQPALWDTYMPKGSLEYYASKSPQIIQWMAELFGIDVDTRQGLIDLKIAARLSHYSWIEASNMLVYANLYLEKNYEEALLWVEPLVNRFPRHPFFAFLKGEALAKAGKWEQLDAMMPDLENFTNTELFLPRNECQIKLSYIRALKTFANGQYEDTITLTTWMIDNYYMEFDWLLGFAHNLRGNSYDLLGERELAIRDYRVTARLENRYPEVEEAKKLLTRPYKLSVR